MTVIEIILLPCMAWLIHRQEQQFKIINELENKIIVMNERLPKRKDDYGNSYH